MNESKTRYLCHGVSSIYKRARNVLRKLSKQEDSLINTFLTTQLIAIYLPSHTLSLGCSTRLLRLFIGPYQHGQSSLNL